MKSGRRNWTERVWNLSGPVSSHDVFLSHTWRSKGRWKVLALTMQSGWFHGLLAWFVGVALLLWLQSFWCYPRCVGECGHFSWRIRNHNFHGALDSNVWWSFHGDGIVHITFSSAEDQDLLFGRSVHPPRTWWTLWERGLQHWWMPFSCERAPGAVFSRILIEPLVLIRDCGFPKGESWWQIGVLAVVHRKICRHLCHSRVVHIPD